MSRSWTGAATPWERTPCPQEASSATRSTRWPRARGGRGGPGRRRRLFELPGENVRRRCAAGPGRVRGVARAESRGALLDEGGEALGDIRRLPARRLRLHLGVEAPIERPGGRGGQRLL